MSNRTTWKFTYTAKDLYNAVQKKVDYHNSRLTWWKSKKEETKSKGLSSSPTVGEGVMSGSVVA